MRGFAVENLDDVEAILSFDEIRDGAFRLAKGGLLKLRNGLAFDDPAEVAAFGLGGVVFRIFLGQIFEVCALLGLLLDIFRFLADFGDFRVGLTDGFKKDVLHVDAIFNFVLINVGVVVGAQDVVTDLGVGAELVDIEERVSGGAFLGHLIFRSVPLEV